MMMDGDEEDGMLPEDGPIPGYLAATVPKSRYSPRKLCAVCVFFHPSTRASRAGHVTVVSSVRRLTRTRDVSSGPSRYPSLPHFIFCLLILLL